MINRSHVLGAAFVLFFLVNSAMACGGGPQDSFITCVPGMALWGTYVGLTLTILAGFLERPFMSLAGVTSCPLAFSIQANLMSVIVVSGLTMAFIDARWFGDLAMLWILGAFAMNAGVEWLWLAQPWRTIPRQVRFWPIFWGNLVSAAVIFSLTFWCEIFGTNNYSYWQHLRPYREWIAILTFSACAIVFVVAFIRTRGRVPAPEEPVAGGFEVIPVTRRVPVAKA